MFWLGVSRHTYPVGQAPVNRGKLFPGVIEGLDSFIPCFNLNDVTETTEGLLSWRLDWDRELHVL
jgi:hypothetical protein